MASEDSRRGVTERESAANVNCPLCGESKCRSVGPIRFIEPTTIGSSVVDLSDMKFHLMHCGACDFHFTHPRIPPEKLLASYAETNASHWGNEEDGYTRRYDTLKQMLERHAPGRRVLDVGCFTGSFLHYLGPGWDLNGVEPAVEAAKIAGEKGAKILGSTLEDIPADAAPFDAIVAIDVAEHINDPLRFFEQMRNRLGPRGILIIVTGDTHAPSWRWMKNRYWYCSFAGHVSFFSERVMKFLGRRLGMDIAEYRRLEHIRSRPLRHIKMLIYNVAYNIGVMAGGLGIPSLRKITSDAPGPSWITARDHMFCVMRRI